MNRSNGFLLVQKPVGITSSNLVLKIKKIGNFQKIGHTGTLDRLASGLMILPTNQYTCFSDRFLGKDKKYRVKIQPGISTDSGDLDGEILETFEKTHLKNEFSARKSEIEAAILELKLSKVQFPPKVSALKLKGQRYSDLYRKNIPFEVKERVIQIFDIILHSQSYEEIDLSIHVSSGTYIRKIVQDLSLQIKIPLVLSGLERTEIGGISLESADTVENWEKGNFSFKSLEMLYPLPCLEVGEDYLKKIKHGTQIPGNFPVGEFLFTHNGLKLAWCRGEGDKFSYLKVFLFNLQ